MEEFQGLCYFPRKMILYSSTKFSILKPLTNFQSLGRFDLGLLQTSKEIYTKLQRTEKVFGEFQALPLFPRKIVLYWSTKFGILKTWTNNAWLKRFDLGFWQTSKQIYRKLQYKDKVFGEFQVLPRYSKKAVCIRRPNFTF